MALQTVYCAQGFWRRNGQIHAGNVYEFSTAERAVAGGEILAASADGVAVFSLTGEPDVDYWDEPVLLATWGETPGTDTFDQSEAA